MAAMAKHSAHQLLLPRTCSTWKALMSREVKSYSSFAYRRSAELQRSSLLCVRRDFTDRVPRNLEICSTGTPSIYSSLNTFSTSSHRSFVIPLTGKGWRSGVTYMKYKIVNTWQNVTTKKKSLRKSALVMYSCCTDPINHIHFFNVLGMPDTFNSWHKITELHVWMCAVRMGNESHTGKFIRNEIVKAFWQDVDKRSSRLGPEVLVGRKKAVGALSDQFRAALFGYDEGFLREDRHLAAAIWRHFFAMDCDDPQRIELLVYYVRKQIENLESQDSHRLMDEGIVEWLAISDVRD